MRSLQHDGADTTYLEFFGLTQPPFARLDDPSRLFHTEQYSLLIEHLDNAAAQTDSLVVVCGADGSGKSTLLNHYTAGLDEHISYVVIDETCKDDIQFYTAFLTQIGFEGISGTLNELRNITKQFLVCRGIAGDHVLVLFDNAHQTDPRVLKELRWLCQIKIKDQRVLSVVLAGNAGLVRVVDAPAMREVRFRGHVVFSIRAYSEKETANYIWHRLTVAGGDAGVKLPHESHVRIHRYSGGIPRLINNLCHATLAEAHALGTRVVTERIVRAVADRHQLLPHVIPLHGKGRRRTDPDYQHLQPVPDKADADSKSLRQQVARLSEQVDDLRADKVRAIQEIEARNRDIVELRGELGSLLGKVDELQRSSADDAGEIARQNFALSESAAALQDIENRSNQLASELENETRAREAAEAELAKATATIGDLDQTKQALQTTVDDLQVELVELKDRLEESQKEREMAELRVSERKDSKELQRIKKTSSRRAAELRKEKRAKQRAEKELTKAKAKVDELSQLKQELQQAVDNLKAELKVANARTADFELLEKESADLKVEFDARTGELESLRGELDSLRDAIDERNQELADLELQLEDSRQEREQAELRASDLTDPRELQEIEEAAARLATDLEKERLARESAENNLVSLRHELDSRNEILADLEVRLDRSQSACELAQSRILELKSPTELKQIETNLAELAAGLEKEGSAREAAESELASQTRALEDLEVQLEESRAECQSTQLRVAALQNPEELEDTKKASDRLAADLEKERQRRAMAEDELADATTTVGELSQLKEELQAKVHELNAHLRAAGDQAVEVYALERSVADLRHETENKSRELEQRERDLADLEEQLAASRRECASLRDRASLGPMDATAGSKGNENESARDIVVRSSSEAVASVQRSLPEAPVYRQLREFDPDFYDGLATKYRQLLLQGLTDKQVSDALRTEQTGLLERLLPRASNQAILDYARLIVDQLDEFQLDGIEPCLKLLVPPSSPVEDSPAVYSESTRKRELDLLGLTLKTYHAIRPIPQEEHVWPDLEPKFAELFRAFGADNVAAMQNSYDPRVDRVLVCNVTRALYSGILSMPKVKAANALRWLLST